MNRNTRTLTFLAVLVLVASLAHVPAIADDDDFDFDLDPGIVGGRFTDIDTDSAKFEEYRELGSGFSIPKLVFTGEQKNGDRFFEFRASKVRERDARYTFSYDVPGSYSLEVDYNKIPHRFGNNGTLLWTRTGDGTYEIADPIQEALQEALETQFAIDKTQITYPFLSGLLDPYLEAAGKVDVGLQRDRTKARFDLGKMGRLAWGMELRHENREGTRPYGASLGFSNVDELPEPIDYDTTDAEIAGEWNAERGKSGGLRFGLRFSRFENRIDSLTWDNPWRAVDGSDASAYAAPGSGSISGSSRGRNALPPDNDANSLFVDGRATFGKSGWFNASAVYTVMTQDEKLLPYTINTAVNEGTGAPFDASDPANLPRGSADTEAKQLSASAGVGTRFGDSFSLDFRYTMQDYANESTKLVIPGYVRFDAVWEEEPRQTWNNSFNRQEAGLNFGWDFGKGNHLGFGYKLLTWDREEREVSKSDEGIFKLSFDSRAVDWMSLRASVERGDRNIGTYNYDAHDFTHVEMEEEEEEPSVLEGMRKLDEAARTYDGFNLMLQFMPGDLTIAFMANGRNDNYDETGFGLVKDEIVQLGVELGYQPNDDTNLYVFAQRADRESFQRSRQSGATLSTNPQDNWQVTFDEVNDTFGAGFTAELAKRWSTDIAATWSKADGDADFYSPPGGTPDVAVDFGNYEDIELFTATARLNVKLVDHAKLSLAYMWEDYTIDSFISKGLQPYLPGTLLLDADNGDYTASVVFANLRLDF